MAVRRLTLICAFMPAKGILTIINVRISAQNAMEKHKVKMSIERRGTHRCLLATKRGKNNGAM